MKRFLNISGGYELRSEKFKGSSTPKDISFFNNNSENLNVFEGFFNFLSYQSSGQILQPRANFLILNSLSFFEKSRTIMEDHSQINLYLDRDNSGIKATNQTRQWSGKYIDQSTIYKDRKDLNEWLMEDHIKRRQANGPKRHL